MNLHRTSSKPTLASSCWILLLALTIHGGTIGNTNGHTRQNIAIGSVDDVDGGNIIGSFVNKNNNNNNYGMGMAAAFSPPPSRTILPHSSLLNIGRGRRRRARGVVVVGGGGGLHNHQQKKVMMEHEQQHYAASSLSDSNTNGDVITGSAENQQHTPVNDSDDGDGDMATTTIATTTTTNITKRDTAEEFDEVVNARYACTRFQRYQEPQHDNSNNNNNNNSSTSTTTTDITTTVQPPTASLSNPSTIQKVHQCLALSQRAPTGFNVQPYRIVLVHSKKDKERLANYCLGRNAFRVRDSDCTAVFLADRECGRDGRRFADFLVENADHDSSSSSSSTSTSNDSDGNAKSTPTSSSRARRPLSSRALLKLRALILLFSSGYPLPRFLSVPLSFGVRFAVSIVSFVARLFHRGFFQHHRSNRSSNALSSSFLLPTLSSAETWSTKNTMLVAMTFLLACTSRGLATCPMEGVDAVGVRTVLGVPRGRFSVPLIVSVGTPYHRRKKEEEGVVVVVRDDDGDDGSGDEEETDDVGLSHSSSRLSPRYPLEEVVYDNAFGTPFMAIQ